MREQIRPKIIQGKALTGRMLLTMAENFVNALNSGGIPNIQSSLD